MKSKRKGLKLLFAMLTLSGCMGVILSSCSPTVTPKLSVVTPTPDSTPDPKPTPSPVDDTKKRQALAVKIENAIKDKLNSAIGLDRVSNVKATHFNVGGDAKQKTIETVGTFVVDNTKSKMSVTLPITKFEYENFAGLDFDAVKFDVGAISADYSLKQLSFAYSVVSDNEKTFSQVKRDNKEWDIAGEKEARDRAERLKYQQGLEDIIADMLNNQIGHNYNIVKKVEAHSVEVGVGPGFTDTVMFKGKVTTNNESNAPFNASLPITESEYNQFYSLKFSAINGYDSTFVDCYNLVQLQYASAFYSAHQDQAFVEVKKNDQVWNLSAESTAILEKWIEEKYSPIVYKHYGDLYQVDLKYAKLRTDIDLNKTYLELCGYANTVDDHTFDISFGLCFDVSDQNLQKLSTLTNASYNENKDLCENYSFDQISILKDVLTDDTTKLYAFDFTGSIDEIRR